MQLNGEVRELCPKLWCQGSKDMPVTLASPYIYLPLSLFSRLHLVIDLGMVRTDS